MAPPPRPLVDPVLPGPSPALRRRRERFVLAVGMSISAVVHLIFMSATIGRSVQVDGPGRDARRVVPRRFEAIRIVEIAPLEAADAASPSSRRLPGSAGPGSAPLTEPAIEVPEPSLRTAVPADEPEEAPTRGFRLGDPRLLRAPTPHLWSPPDPARDERARLRAHVDSVVMDRTGTRIPAGSDMSVWTARDGNGRRWGLSPGRIHLGTVTVALCSGNVDASDCGFGVPPGARDAYKQRVRALVEIQRQTYRAAIEMRAFAIRLRRDSLRESSRLSRH